jgi:hypothetical protein
VKFRQQAKLDPARLVGLVRQRGDLTLVPPNGVKLSLSGAVGSGPAKASAPKPQTTQAKPAPAASRQPPAPKRGTKESSVPPSWWTARARTGEVTSGFTKEEILKPAKDNPRAPGGVFERVGGFLSELVERG